MFYQIYPRSFSDANGDGVGDLPGIIDKLDYLNAGTPDSLGIDAIWLSPIFTSPDHDFGYDIADYCAIDPRYGTLDDFDRLVLEARRRGIKIMLDLVVNHTASQHPWFLEARSSRNSEKRDWYIWKDGQKGNKKPPNNWRSSFYGPAWTWDDKTGQYYLHTFLKEQPDLNWRNPQVRAAIAGVIRFWLDREVDGFRLDVPHFYCKDEQFRNNPCFFKGGAPKDRAPFYDRFAPANLMRAFAMPGFKRPKFTAHQPETHAVIREFRRIFEAYPGVTSVGEISEDAPSTVATYYGQNSDELHMNFYFELLNCRWKAGAFKRCVERWEEALPEGAWPAYAFSNHDVVRAASRYDHDGQGDKRARLLAMMLLTLRGTPFIYYGEEVAMKEARLQRKDLKDPPGVKWHPFYRGRDGCRTPMHWNEEPFGGFSTSMPWLPVGPELSERNVAVQQKDSSSQLTFMKNMIRLRKSSPALLEGSYRSVDEGVPAVCYCYFREVAEQIILVALNFSPRKQEIGLIAANRNNHILLSTCPQRVTEKAALSPLLEPFEGLIAEIK